MTALALARAIGKLTLTKKASDVVLMDLRGLTSMADFFVVCSADSDIQVNAIAGAVEDGMETEGVSPWHAEKGSGNWVLLDYVDVVLHIFHRNAREFYSLDKLWGDAQITAIDDAVKAKPAKGSRPATRKPVAPRRVAPSRKTPRRMARKRTAPKQKKPRTTRKKASR